MGVDDKQPLLFLSAHVPSPEPKEAGQKTAFRHLTWLAQRYRITLLCFRKTPDRKLDLARVQALCDRAFVFDVDRAARLRGVLRRPDLPLVVAARWSPRAARLIEELTYSQTFQRVHCEWSQMAVYAPFLRKIPCRTVYAHDVLYQYCGRRVAASPPALRSLWRVEAARTRRWECRSYSFFSWLYVPSRKDRDLVGDLSPTQLARTTVLTPEFTRFQPPESRGSGNSRLTSGNPRLIFWGALRRKENALGAAWLMDEVLPLIRRQIPSAELFLVGADPPQWLERRARGKAGVLVTGFVEDPGRYFAIADLAVLPLFQGAGVKVKVLECLAAGLPVVTTPVGAEGIEAGPEEGLLVVEPDPNVFAQAVLSLLSAPKELTRLGENAARWAATGIAHQPQVILYPPGCENR